MKKLTYEECLLRASEDFKDLVIYVCVTRAKHNKDFFENGTFSPKKMVRMFKFVESWKKRTSNEKKLYAKRYALISKSLNYAFGIDHHLVKQVLGRYVDKHGKKVCIKIDDVLNMVNGKHKIVKEVNAGRKFEFEDGKHKKDADGKSVVKCYWNKKYLIDNKDYWFLLLNDDKYNDIRKFASNRLQKMVFDWFNVKFGAEGKTVEAGYKDKQADEAKQVEKQVEKKAFAEEIKPLEITELQSLFKRYAMNYNEFTILVKYVYGIKTVTGINVDDFMTTYKRPDIPNDKKANEEEVAMMWKRLYLGNCKNKNFCNAALKEVIEENYKKTNGIIDLD